MTTAKKAETPLRSYRGSSGDARKVERRQKLLNAAIQEYGAHGYRNVGVRMICAAAGLTERYFYEAFPNSEALLIASLDALTDQLVSTIREAGRLERGDPERRRRAMLSTYYDDLRSRPAAARVFLVEINGVSPAVDAAFARSLDSFAELILDTFDPDRHGRAAADLVFRRGITGALFQIALVWIAEKYARPLEEVTGAALAFCQLAEPITAT